MCSCIVRLWRIQGHQKQAVISPPHGQVIPSHEMRVFGPAPCSAKRCCFICCPKRTAAYLGFAFSSSSIHGTKRIRIVSSCNLSLSTRLVHRRLDKKPDIAAKPPLLAIVGCERPPLSANCRGAMAEGARLRQQGVDVQCTDAS